VPEIAALTAEPARYGFHATLKPPFHLRSGTQWDALLQTARDLASQLRPFTLPPLAVADIEGFLALREMEPCPELQTTADACIEALDAFRAPPGEAEIARRRRHRLSPLQQAMLERWGYPYAFDTWFFHLTLTSRLSAAEQAAVRAAAELHFAPSLESSRRVSALCLFTQVRAEAPFVLACRLPLGDG
jgi:hypothetical protein